MAKNNQGTEITLVIEMYNDNLIIYKLRLTFNLQTF